MTTRKHEPGQATRHFSRNAILNGLPIADLARLRPHLVEEALPLRHSLYAAGRRIEEICFPEDAVCSIVVVMRSGAMAEVATVGNEGLVGLAHYFGHDTEPSAALVQVPGRVHLLPARIFREELSRNGALRRVVGSYAHVRMMKALQSAACNQLHSLEQRMCKWLLMTDDRVSGDSFVLTQEFLSLMLGARRPTVSAMASDLRNKGLIDYQRGRVTVLNRAGLRASACECYAVVTSHFQRYLFRDRGVRHSTTIQTPIMSAPSALSEP